MIAQNAESASTSDTLSNAKTQRARRLVILLHGIRGRGSVMEAIGDSWRVTLPQGIRRSHAPFRHPSGGYHWFAIDDQGVRPDRIKDARQAFDEVLSDIVKREGFECDLKSVAFVGVSQGAIIALDAVATRRWKVGALVSFAGLLPMPATTTALAARLSCSCTEELTGPFPRRLQSQQRASSKLPDMT